MTENASGNVFQTAPETQTSELNKHQAVEETTPSSAPENPIKRPGRKGPNKILIGIIAVLAVVAFASGIFLVKVVKDRLDSRISDGETSQNSQAQENTEESNIYLDSANRFRFSYPDNVEVVAGEEEIVINQNGQELMSISSKQLSQDSMLAEVNSQIDLLDAQGEPVLTKIGTRAGFEFNTEGLNYKMFPLSENMMLEIKTTNSTETVDEIISSIEFLPPVQTS